MPNYKITLQRFIFKSQDAPADSAIIVYKDKNTPRAAYEYAHELALDLFGVANGEGKVIYTIEEVLTS